MADLVVVLLLCAVVLGASWWLRDLRPLAPGPLLVGPARVTVVVPARDEERTLPLLLSSLRAAPPGLLREVVVVDDASRDRTAEVALAHGARVLPAGVPPPGWTGKAWACHVGAQGVTDGLLLFLDADTTLAPGALEGLLAEHGRRGGLVSVQPFHEVRRPYEQLSAYFNVVSVLASGAFGGGAVRPVAFGPCLLASPADHELAGGHAAVRGEVLDDVRLAAAYDRVGLPVTCLTGGSLVRMRSYPGGPRQLLDGWTKNIASGAAAVDRRAALSAVLWVAAHHAVAAGALPALVRGVVPGGGPGAGWASLWWVLGWVVVTAQLRWGLRRLGAFRWWTWVLFPVPLLAFDLVFARSLARTVVAGSVRWRERTVAVRPTSGRAR